jgi:hypothetical protein
VPATAVSATPSATTSWSGPTFSAAVAMRVPKAGTRGLNLATIAVRSAAACGGVDGSRALPGGLDLAAADVPEPRHQQRGDDDEDDEQQVSTFLSSNETSDLISPRRAQGLPPSGG